MIRQMHDAGRVDAPEAAEVLGQPLDLVQPGDGVLGKMGGAVLISATVSPVTGPYRR
jgi:hypothetical protein